MTQNELIIELRQQARRVAEYLPAHRECLATVLRLRAIGGYATPEAAEQAVNTGVAAVNGTRQQIEEIERQVREMEQPGMTPAEA